MISSPVNGLTPFPALRDLTSRRARTPITGKRTRCPVAAILAPVRKLFSIAFFNSERLILTWPFLAAEAMVKIASCKLLIKENLPPFLQQLFSSQF